MLFALNSKLHDAGPVKAEWNRQTRFLATVGMNNIVHIVTRRGEIWYEVMLPQPVRSNMVDPLDNQIIET